MNTLAYSLRPAGLWKSAAAFGAGALFAVGLVVSGMTQPAKVAGFLDFFGDWDPALAGVMGGGVLVNLVLHRWITRKLGRPLLDVSFWIPSRRDIDARLLVGAAIFGVGWGLGGYCPGPGIVSLVTGAAEAWVFVLFMIAGVLAARRFSR
jgi:uncharacterized membrane protein YedE/YeeE